jgi:hypothetical protein
VSRIRRTKVALFAVAAVGVAMAPVAAANPTPSTEGGNGAGKSGQCTGPNAGFLPEQLTGRTAEASLAPSIWGKCVAVPA